MKVDGRSCENSSVKISLKKIDLNNIPLFIYAFMATIRLLCPIWGQVKVNNAHCLSYLQRNWQMNLKRHRGTQYIPALILHLNKEKE